jgi:hypothetical protein
MSIRTQNVCVYMTGLRTMTGQSEDAAHAGTKKQRRKEGGSARKVPIGNAYTGQLFLPACNFSITEKATEGVFVNQVSLLNSHARTCTQRGVVGRTGERRLVTGRSDEMKSKIAAMTYLKRRKGGSGHVGCLVQVSTHTHTQTHTQTHQHARMHARKRTHTRTIQFVRQV